MENRATSIMTVRFRWVRAAAIGLIGVIVLLLSGWLLLTNAQAGVQRTGTVQEIDVLDYGTYEAEKIDRITELSGVSRDIVDNVQLLGITNRIPAKVGVKFGFRYFIVGQPLDSRVTLKAIIVYPPAGAVSPKSGLLHTISYPKPGRIGPNVSFVGYSADEPWELVPGIWTVQLWRGDTKFAEQTFTMTPQQDAGTGQQEAIN
jgi:hypothetical protein